jgi:restriction system protein
MALPDFQSIMRPILVSLTTGEAHSLPQIRAEIAKELGVTDEEQQILLPSGKQTTFSNRVAWALTHMGKAGLAERPARGQYTITERGRQVLSNYPERVDLSVLGTFPEYVAFRAIRHEKQETSGSSIVSTDVSPSEAIGALVEDSNATLAADLLERVLAQPPVFLETLALRLLAAMGYGGRESVLEHTGQSGDAGLDGLVRQDALGLDLIGVQAKRYDPDNPVQRPALQGFVGALQGAQTNRGVFVTTGRFTQGARQFAESVAMQLVLIDGAELTRLMVEYNIGVSVKETFDLKQIDEVAFEE